MNRFWQHGRFGGFAIGEHFVMATKQPDGQFVHGVWVLRRRDRATRVESAELLAEFRSKRLANAWCRGRNDARARRVLSL